MTLELEARPGKPRDVGKRGPCKWFVDHDDGTVSFVVRRTGSGGRRYGVELAFHAANDEAALAEYERWSQEQYEKTVRTTVRMSLNGRMT
jgi:hypothetical protein